MLVCVVGNYGDKNILTDGQGIKTVELYNSLVKHYGMKDVSKINLHKKNKIILVFKLLISLIRCKNIIVLVSKNGRKTVIPLLVALNKFFKRKIFHSLIGSTTHQMLQENPELVNCFNMLTGNWSETNTEKRLLEEQGLNNVSVIKNFKNISVLDIIFLKYYVIEPYPLCTFSRIEEMKGITDIVRAVNEVNLKCGRTVYTLDIYGKVMEHYETEFEKLKSEFGNNIKYKGVVDFDKSVETLKWYHMVVFPTKYYTEGIPGTILDAFAAGTPVLSSEWESCFDIITTKVGITYAFNDYKALVDSLDYIKDNSEIVNKMKAECLEESKKYSPNEIMLKICDFLEGKC